MNFQEKSLRIAIATLGLMGAASAFAATAQSDLEVSALVGNNCSISANALEFGNYDPVGANAVDAKTSSSKLSVTCTRDAMATITLSQGQNAADGSSSLMPMRRLNNGAGDGLGYQLFSDASHEMVWGDALDGEEGGNAVSYTGFGSTSSVMVYGVIPGGQNVPAGTYVDTVIATINF